MAKEIKQKIVLEGEKEYNQAIKEAQRNLRTLKSELKAETAELGKNATEQQKAEAKIKSLKKQIAEQEKIVKTYTEALKEVREKYADNEDEIAKWEVKLNNARIALASMKNGLDSVGQGFQEVKGDAETSVVAAHSFAEAFGNLGDIGDSISSAVEGIFTSTTDTVKEAIGELWGLISDTAAKANRWNDVAGYWGTDAQTIQAYARAVAGSANSFDDLNSAVTRLVLGGKGDKITELLGISNENYDNQWDYAIAVMNQINDMTKSGRKMEPIYEQIFGAKRSTSVMDLINDWDTIQGLVEQFNGDSSGYGLTSGMLADFDEIDVKISTVESKWDALKDRFAGGFGNATLDVLVNVESGLDALAKYFDADTPEEREAAMEELHEAILATFESVAQAIRDGIAILEEVSEELKQSEDPIVQGVGNILGAIVDALKWFTEDNAHNVVTALEIIAGFWLTGKGLAMGAKIAEIVGNIKTIQLFNALGGAGSAGAGAGAGASAGAGAAGGGAATGVGTVTAGGSMFPLMLQSAGVAAVAIAPAVIAQAADEARVEEKRQARIDAAQNLGGTEQSFLMAAANALGLDWHGGNESVIEALLMGLGDRSDLQKSQLHNLLNGSFTSAGYDTWGELQRLWGGEGMETGRMVAMLDAIADAYTKIPETPADWWQNPGSGGNSDTITGSDLQNFRGMPAQLAAAVRSGAASGVAGIQVLLDGHTVGRLAAPYVSEYIARDMED